MQFGTYERQTLLVAMSNLTGNVWNGELLVFDDWTVAPSRSKAISKFTTPVFHTNWSFVCNISTLLGNDLIFFSSLCRTYRVDRFQLF